MTRIYLPGEIKEEHRGKETIIIVSEKDGRLGAFQYDIFSEEVVAITGTRTIQSPLQRAYLGLSREACKIVQVQGRTHDEGFNFDYIDRELIIPHFLEEHRGWERNQNRKNQSIPEKWVGTF